jgi:tetratricopeptide (TPR) repeat protein
MKNNILTYVFIFLLPLLGFAQENLGDAPTDDLGDVTDEFQEAFFEALKQKGVENYELALNALDKAERAAQGDQELLAVVSFEKGKNLVSLKKYNAAELQFENVLSTTPDQLDVMESLYNVYYLQRNYEKAIPLVIALITKDSDYKEDLANLYLRTQQYDEAIVILDELDQDLGESAYRNTLRTSIYRATGNNEQQIEKLETRVDANPKKEQDYLSLIYLYSDEGNTAKAFETAKELLKNQPKSQMVHLALYKFYLAANQTKEAIKSMELVFESQQIDKESKYRVLGDFISFVDTHPEFEKTLEKTVHNFSEENGAVYEKLGDYYVSKNRKEEAVAAYKKGLANDADNYSLLKNTLLILINLGQFEEAATYSSNGLDIFPAQPLLYLLNGVANIGLQNTGEAIESLETGVDYVVENDALEKDFFTQLEKAYTLKGNIKKAAEYAKRAASIVIN